MINDNFCPAPWTSIYVDPAGMITNCCVSQSLLGNVKKHNIEEIVHGPINKKIKSTFLNNKKPIGCSICNKNSDNTFRNVMIEKFENVLDKSYFENVDNYNLYYADLRFRNTCNYACIYCGPNLSSLWASDVFTPPKHDTEINEKQLEFLYKNLSTLREIYLAGGEPLLIKENEYILSKLLKVNPNVKIFVNTNLSLIKNNRIFELLLQFNNVTWIVSVDDMGDRYNYIRYPGDWNNFYSNLKLLHNRIIRGLKHNITFAMVYTILNSKSIFDCIDFLINEGLDKYNFKIMYVNYRNNLDPRNYYSKEKKDLINFLETKIRFYESSNIVEEVKQNLCKDILTLKQTVESTMIIRKIGIELVVEFLANLDKKRNINSKEVFSDLYNIYEQYV